MIRVTALLVAALVFTAPFFPFGVWIAAVLDSLVIGFFLTMIVSRRARFAFADWLERHDPA